MIFSENQYPPRIKSGAGFFGIMLKLSQSAPSAQGGARRRPPEALRDRPDVAIQPHV
jgi:hypothetical protein